jgi:thiamine biosynthesis lipoprotein
MQADPPGTTLSVLGAERGMAYARKHGLAVLMVVRTAHGFEQRLSPAFAAELQR